MHHGYVGKSKQERNSMSQATYNPAIFDVTNIRDAKAIILTPEDGLTTDERWATESPYLLDLIEQNCNADLDRESVVMDYGCGIGRLSLALIQRFGCTVVGVDFNANMRALAANYVNDPRFFAMAPETVHVMGKDWADLALAVWVIQHLPEPALEQATTNLKNSVKPTGSIFMVNSFERFLPTKEFGWASDGIDIHKHMQEHFNADKVDKLDPNVVTESVTERTYWAVYRQKTNGA